MTYIVVTYSCSFTFFFCYVFGFVRTFSRFKCEDLHCGVYRFFLLPVGFSSKRFFTAGRFFPWGAFDQWNSAPKSFSVLTCPFFRVVVMLTKSVQQST